MVCEIMRVVEYYTHAHIYIYIYIYGYVYIYIYLHKNQVNHVLFSHVSMHGFLCLVHIRWQKRGATNHVRDKILNFGGQKRCGGRCFLENKDNDEYNPLIYIYIYRYVKDTLRCENMVFSSVPFDDYISSN